MGAGTGPAGLHLSCSAGHYSLGGGLLGLMSSVDMGESRMPVALLIYEPALRRSFPPKMWCVHQ